MTTLSIKPKIESLPLLYSFCEEQGVAPRLMLVLEEAFVNVVNYSGATLTEIRCTRRDYDWVFELEDNGMEFDPTAFQPQGDMDAEPLKTGGHGIRIMRSLTDVMNYRREKGRNILTLIKSDKTKEVY